MPFWILRLRFPRPCCSRSSSASARSSAVTPGELRFVVEHALELGDLIDRVTPRQRALELFGLLRVWDTETNNGVLIYVLYAEHAVEIVADRGLARSGHAGRVGFTLPRGGGEIPCAGFRRGRARGH